MNETKLEVGQTWGFVTEGSLPGTILSVTNDDIGFTLVGSGVLHLKPGTFRAFYPTLISPAPPAKEPPRCLHCAEARPLSDRHPLKGLCLPCSGAWETKRREEYEQEIREVAESKPVPFPRASWPEPIGGWRCEPRWTLRDVKR
jgi:hypothetical protein